MAPGQRAVKMRRRGYSLVELMLVLALSGILASVTVPAYARHVERARIAESVGVISDMSLRVYLFRELSGHFPDTLAEAVSILPLDPWGQPYRYLRIDGAPNSASQRRADAFLKRLNTDFDLYSIGADGRTTRGLGGAGKDDIVRAGNGAFVELGEDF